MTPYSPQQGSAAHIGQRLQMFRKARGLRLTDVAQGIVSVGYLSMIEQGQRTPSHQVLRALAQRLDVDEAVLESGSLNSARLGDVLRLQEALWASHKGRRETAIEIFRSCLNEGTSVAAEATRGLARALLRTGRPAEALAVVRRPAASMVPEADWATAVGNLLIAGLALLRLGDLAAAHEVLQEAIDITQTRSPGSDLDAMALLYLGRCQLRRGLVAPAIVSFEAFLRNPTALVPFQPVEPAATQLWKVAEASLERGDTVGAIRERERALALQAMVNTARVRLRLALEVVGFLLRARTSEALAVAAQTAHRLRAVADDMDDMRFRSDLLLVSAEIALRMQAPTDALALVDEALARDDDADLAWASMLRALAYESLDNRVAAREHADQCRVAVGIPGAHAIGSDELSEPWELLSQLYLRLGDADMSWRCLRRAAAGAGIPVSLLARTRELESSRIEISAAGIDSNHSGQASFPAPRSTAHSSLSS